MIMAGHHHFHLWLQTNGLFSPPRVSYAMARDGLFFQSTGMLNKNGVPGSALVYQEFGSLSNFTAHAEK